MSQINTQISELSDNQFAGIIVDFPIFLKHISKENIIRFICSCPAGILELIVTNSSYLDLEDEAIQEALVKRHGSFLKKIPNPKEKILELVLQSYLSKEEES